MSSTCQNQKTLPASVPFRRKQKNHAEKKQNKNGSAAMYKRLKKKNKTIIYKAATWAL